MKRTGIALGVMTSLFLFGTALAAKKQAKLEIRVAYLEQQVERPPVLSNLDEIPDDEGLQGARLGIKDNNAAGRFLGQDFQLQEVVVPVGGDLLGAAKILLNSGHQFLVVNLPTDDLLKVADLPEASEAVLFNAGSRNNNLREQDCRTNVLHTLPSRAMLTDALGQYLLYMKWKRWFLVSGNQPRDVRFANSLRRTAKRYGLKIVEDKQWTFGPDMRRLAQQEFPLFTQTAEEYDVLVVADEAGDFGEYLPYHTRDPRPVVGTQGLFPAAWHPVVEQWGAAQLQKRFHKLAKRSMSPMDYAAWVALRALSEGVTRTKSNDPHVVRSYLLGDQLKIAGFKGLSLSFRNWSGQLRQPISLMHPKALVTTSPQQGFLHPHTELDTLGFDGPESKCNAFQ